MVRSIKRLPLLLVLALAVAACGQDGGGGGGGGGTDKKALKIAFMGALTGDYAQLVIHAKQGAELAIEEANAKGDLPVTLELEAQDTGGDKDRAVPIANQLKDDQSLVAVVGPAFSGESFAVNPILGQAGIPAVTPSATNPGLNAIPNVSGKTWFRAVGNDNSQGNPAPDVIFKHLKATRVYIAHDKSAYGQGLASIVRDGVNKNYAGKLAGFEGVDPGRKDYSTLVSKIIGSKADVFYWGGYSPEGSLIAKQLREKGSETKFLGADGAKDDTFLKVGTAVNGAVLTCPCDDPTASQSEGAKAFVQAYNEKFDTAPGVYGGEGYDAANVIIEAIKKAGEPGDDISAYRQKVAESVAQTSGFQGVTKSYDFEDNGELAEASVTIYLYEVENNKFKFLGKVDDLIQGA